MPHLPPVASAIITILGFTLAITRLLTASRPFWASFPAYVQKGIPALLVALGALPAALEYAKTWLDVAVALVLAISAWFTASRGDQSPPKDSDGGPRLQRSNTDPKVDDVSVIPEPTKLTAPDRSRLHNDQPDGAEMRDQSWRHQDWRLAIACLALLMLPSCASWKPVVRTISDIAKDLCIEHFGAKTGLSPADVAKKFCETRDDIEPWTDALLAAKRDAAPIAEARKP